MFYWLLQALKSLSHNYPNVMTLCWEQISFIIYGVLSTFPDESSRLWRGNVEQTAVSLKERVMTAAVKVDLFRFDLMLFSFLSIINYINAFYIIQ